MKYEKAKIYEEVKIGEDELNNAVYENVEIMKVNCRFTEWTAENVNVLGRDFTSSHRQCVVFSSREKLKKATVVYIGNDKYSVTQVISGGRLFVFYLKAWRI